MPRPGRFPYAWPLGPQREEQGDFFIFTLALLAIFSIGESSWTQVRPGASMRTWARWTYPPTDRPLAVTVTLPGCQWLIWPSGSIGPWPRGGPGSALPVTEPGVAAAGRIEPSRSHDARRPGAGRLRLRYHGILLIQY